MDADRLPAICGKATLAMEESSTTMKVASITETATIHGFTVGRHSTGGAPRRSAGLLAVLIRQFTSTAAIFGCGAGFADETAGPA